MRQLSIFLFISLLTISCATPYLGSRKIHKAVVKAEFDDHFYGINIYDPSKKKYLYTFNDTKLFTPASNVKIFTLLAALKTFGDSIPALGYVETEDSLFFEGTGNPVFLHPDIGVENDSAFSFLEKQQKKLVMHIPEHQPDRFGKGWMWDDYAYGFQTERSSFPIYGNQLVLNSDKLKESPFEIKIDTATSGLHQLSRAETSNDFVFTWSESDTVKTLSFPMTISNALVVELLQDTLKRKVSVSKQALSISDTIYQNAKSVYQKMMIESDNFLAEQFLLSIAYQLNQEFDVAATIDSLLSRDHDEFKNQIIWVDGSGLSRYNKFSPRSISVALQALYSVYDWDYLSSFFAVGGESGTLKNWYKAPTPYVYAKTGTMSGIHCLSGYIETKRGKRLILSIMHNNYKGSSRTVKLKMEELLISLREQF